MFTTTKKLLGFSPRRSVNLAPTKDVRDDGPQMKPLLYSMYSRLCWPRSLMLPPANKPIMKPPEAPPAPWGPPFDACIMDPPA